MVLVIEKSSGLVTLCALCLYYVAYCDVVQYLPCYEWLLREVKRYGPKWKKCWAQEPALKKIISLVPNILIGHVQIVDTTLYPGWQDYLKCFLQVGGLIEGVPPSDSITPVAVDIMIEPSGQIKIHCTLDQVRKTDSYS